MARRTRQYPIDYGHFSTYVETIEVPEIEEPSRRLLAAMRYSGLIELEFKLDPRVGSFKLLDMNPRLWGWHSLGQAAGIDFPFLAWRMALGDAISEVRAQTGIRWVRFTADAVAARQAILRGSLTPRAYIRSLMKPGTGAIFARDDPSPAVGDLIDMVYLSSKRRRHMPIDAEPRTVVRS